MLINSCNIFFGLNITDRLTNTVENTSAITCNSTHFGTFFYVSVNLFLSTWLKFRFICWTFFFGQSIFVCVQNFKLKKRKKERERESHTINIKMVGIPLSFSSIKIKNDENADSTNFLTIVLSLARTEKEPDAFCHFISIFNKLIFSFLSSIGNFHCLLINSFIFFFFFPTEFL